MKAEVATWIWVLGLTVMGILVFTIGMSIGGDHLKNTQRYMAVDEFSMLVSKSKMVCQGGIENIYPHRADFPENIKAIYSSEIRGPPPDKVSVMIRKGERSVGKFLCIQFYGDEPLCEEINCNINMSYLGTPSLKEDLFSRINQIVDEGTSYSYEMVLVRAENGDVVINSEKVISLKDDSPCGNGVVEIGEECDSLTNTCEPIYGSCSRIKCMNCMCVVNKECSFCATSDEVCVMGSYWEMYCMESNETDCDDAVDNDCDGNADSADPDCA